MIVLLAVVMTVALLAVMLWAADLIAGDLIELAAGEEELAVDPLPFAVAAIAIVAYCAIGFALFL